MRGADYRPLSRTVTRVSTNRSEGDGDAPPARASTAVPAGAIGPPDLVGGAPSTERARGAKGERTRRKLLEAAEAIFGEVGYHEASIVKITEAADVAQGTFYLYFSSKREIFDEVVLDLNQRIRRAMSDAARGATTRLESERLGFAGFFRFTSEHPALYRVIRQAEFVSPKVLRHHYETITSHYAPFLADAMATGEVSMGDPAVLAWALASVGETVGLRWILWNEERAVPPQVFEEMMAIIARMLGGSTTPPSLADPHLVGEWISERALRTPDKAAIIFGERIVTYRELDDTSRALAGELIARGLRPGQRIAVLAENLPEQVALLFACAKSGLVFFPMNWRLTNVELAAQMQVMEPALWFVSSAQQSRVDETLSANFGAPLDLESTCASLADPVDVVLPRLTSHAGLAIIATSGSTGRPKGVLLTHANFFWTNLSLDLVAPITQDDVVLQVLPQFHIGGWNVQPLLALWRGATLVLESGFDPGRVLELISERGVTTMAGVPTNYLMLSQHPDFDSTDFSRLRAAVVGGAAMPFTLVERWRERGVALYQGYGLTECSPNVFCLDDTDAVERPASVGRPYPYVEVALAGRGGDLVEGSGQGELLVRGPGVFAGYWNDPAATASVMDGEWLRTGDVAARDDDGFYRIVGRVKEMFISGGENVYPVEVENVITSFEDVVAAAVVSTPDAKWGESGVAFIECARGATLDLLALKAHCSARLASFKVPSRFVVVDELPRNTVGKIDKATLRRRAADEA